MAPTPHETKDQCECDHIRIQKDKTSKRTGVRRSDNQLKAEEASAHESRTSDDGRRAEAEAPNNQPTTKI
eukprot:scaffold2498_cov74-Cyclotella_meneghiniana.AAC.1